MEADKKPAISAATNRNADDRGESISLMEPLLVRESSMHRTALAELAFELGARATGFRRSLPEGVLTALADLVRSMNCYYSNLIEGHDTHPADIERALKSDYSADPKKRSLQLEAKAHVAVQEWIDGGGLAGRATKAEGICEIHRRFGELMPEELLWATEPSTGKRVRVVPGGLRQRHVKVGWHIPISPGALPRFLERFEAVHEGLGKIDTVLAAATAHHRLLWIHPFLDGNGRVARLMSHAMLLQALDTRGVWSIARGLARSESEYRRLLVECDAGRRNDLDGRGPLSEEALVAFTRFFLETCIDQIRFMEGLMQPRRLHSRIMAWSEEEVRTGALPPRSGNVLEMLLYRGDLRRGEVASLLGASERQARRITSALLGRGVLVSESTRAPLRLAFPAGVAPHWTPGLFPERDG